MAIKQAIITSNTKSTDTMLHKLYTDAPSTLRTPISFVLCSAIKDASPNNPRQEMNMARKAKMDDSLPICSSAANFKAYSSSANLYSKGAEGIIFLNTASILGKALLALTVGFNLILIQS